MRRFVPKGFGILCATTQSTQTKCSLRSIAPADGGFRYWWSPSFSTSAAARGGAGRAEGASSDASGSPWSPFSAVMFIPSMVCGCLAYWQYERMQWKDELIRLRQGIDTAEAKDLLSSTAAPLREYDKVQVRGRFLHEYSLYVGPRPRSVPGSGIQPGYLVITPLVSTDSKGVVLVNRGWVPTAWKEEAEARAAARLRQATSEAKEETTAVLAPSHSAATQSALTTSAARSWWSWLSGGTAGGDKAPSSQQPQSQSTQLATELPQPAVVVGVVQYDEHPSNFMPDNQPETEEFHFVQREAMARILGLPTDTPLIMAISTDPATAQAMQKRSPLDEKRSAATAAAAVVDGGDDASAATGPAYPAPKHVSDLVRFTTMPGDHRNYALIWATLFVTLAFMARTAVTKPLRGPRIVDAPGNNARDAWRSSQAN